MNIKQIMPAAPGWAAVLSEGRGHYSLIPLAGWALVATRPGSDDAEDVIGLIAVPGHQSLELVDLRTLLGYTYPGCAVNWQAEQEVSLVQQVGEERSSQR